MARAKPLGWDEKLSGVELLDKDPYDGPTKEVEGELETVDVGADEEIGVPAYKIYIIDGIIVDPKTLR